MTAQAHTHCAAEVAPTTISVEEITKAARAKIANEKEKFAQAVLTQAELLEYARGGESGDAKLFVRKFQGKLVFDHASGTWYRWEGNHWERDEINSTLAAVEILINDYGEAAKECFARKIAAAQAGKDSEAAAAELEKVFLKKIACLQRRRYRQDVLMLAAAGDSSLGIAGREWDRDPYLLAFPNGVLELHTQQFRPGQPEDYIKIVCPTPWQGFDAPAPRWEQFLSEIFDGDREIIGYVKRLLGYGISGLTVEHIFPIFWGPEGRNGKGTLLEVLSHTLGPLAGPVQGELLLEQKNPRSSAAPSPDIMALRGKRLVWASETDEGRRLNAGRVKLLCGGDTLKGRNPFDRREVTFPPTHTMLLLTNFRPQVNPSDTALWERLHLVEFKISFVDNPTGPNHRPRDMHLSVRLKQEASGIIAWLVAGNCEWQEKGLAPPPQILGSIKEYRKSEDSVVQFIEQCCVVGDGKIGRAKELADAYVDFCEDGGLKSIGKKKFFEKLHNDFLKDRDNRGIYYNGLGLRDVA